MKRDLIKEQAKLRIFKVESFREIKELKKAYKLPIEVRINKLREEGGFKIFLVDGYKIRQFIDLDFTTGGHGLRYVYVPMDEIWLELPYSKYEPEEIILHEITEFKLMKKGINYNRAHEQASLTELELRNRKIILPVGHHRQPTSYSCGPSALKIVLDYYNEKKDIKLLIRETGCDKSGTLHSGFKKALKKLRYKYHEKSNSKIKDIEGFIQKGIPVIVDYQDHHFRPGGHFAVIIGYDEKRFRFSNPSLQRGYEWIDKKEFEKEWYEEDEPGKIVKRWMLAVYRKA